MVLAGLPREAARRIAGVVAVPWALAVGTDRRHPGMVPKSAPQRMLDRYVDRLLCVAHTQPRLAADFATVLNLTASPATLLRPTVAARVLRPGATRS